MNRKKRLAERPEFPKPREEFAGELTPQLCPGPITRAHSSRFVHSDRAGQADAPAVEDNGVWTKDGV